ncbi:hypothetical protein BFP72_10985 [Reichenbachiella sp. 5M10]|nr:pirin family protein [Reichenbachiella sp. 5M10]PIB37521.1 hypothetical protein BFP72_10985 [Reichenbachiella sp. 5M10]
MKTIFHYANSRGHADHGWLNAHHSFSFAGFYDANRTNFGALRVLNDDQVTGGKGFGFHPHDNMEIITIPLEGALEHKDNMGNQEVIRAGDVQMMSAGTGVYHSEYNANPDKDVKLLQIWIFPNQKDVEPRYDQITLGEELPNQLQQIVSPSADDEGVWIHQDAWLHLGRIDKNHTISYALKNPEKNGVYVMILEGEAHIYDHHLGKRDALGIWDTEHIEIQATANARVLLIEVPMQF